MHFASLRRNNKAAAAVEYALVASLIAVSAISALRLVGPAVSNSLHTAEVTPPHVQVFETSDPNNTGG